MPNDYEILAPIAKSYYGKLSLCRGGDGLVASLRTLALGGNASRAAVKRIVQRANRAVGQTHLHIVPELEVYDDGDVVLVTQYVEGAPLSTFARMLMTQPEAPNRKAMARIVVDALAGLEFLAVHDHYEPGGMTPDAIMVCADGRTRLIEPMAQAAFSHVPGLARHQSRVAYRAPEQLGEPAEVSARSDVFTMGIILWELLQKRRLFAGLGYEAIAKQIREPDVPAYSGSPALQDVLERALAKDPLKRFESASEMRAELKATAPHTDAGVVAKLFESVLGGHPSIQRMREVAAKHDIRKPPKRRIPPLRPLTATPSSSFNADDDDVQSSRRPGDSIAPPLPTDAELDAPRRQIGRGEIFTEVERSDVHSVHVGRWLGAAGFARLINVTTLQDKYADDDAIVSAYLDDARIISRVKHPNVMAIHDLLDDDDEMFVVMDYFDGVSLAHVLRQMDRRKETVPIGIGSRIISGILHGLHAAHSATDESGDRAAVVHQDISPDRVIIGADGYARIVQFGLERGLEAGNTRRKRAWRYKAPEQVRGETPDPRTDVYAASAVAYHVYTGRRPFRGREIKKKVLAGEPAKLTKLREELPPKLEEYVLRGMAARAEDRWDDAEAMAEAIDDLPGMASHREVSDWLHDVCEGRLQHSEALKRAVENAPVMLSAEELEEPLSVSNAPRESLAEIKLPPGIFDEGKGDVEEPATQPKNTDPAADEVREAESEAGAEEAEPKVSLEPHAAAVAHVSEAPSQQGSRTLMIAVAAAAASAALVLLLTQGDDETSGQVGPAVPTPTETGSHPPTPQKEAVAPPSANTGAPTTTATALPSTEASAPEPSAASPRPTAPGPGSWPPTTPSQPAPEPSSAPTTAPTAAPTATYRLPDDI